MGVRKKGFACLFLCDRSNKQQLMCPTTCSEVSLKCKDKTSQQEATGEENIYCVNTELDKV